MGIFDSVNSTIKQTLESHSDPKFVQVRVANGVFFASGHLGNYLMNTAINSATPENSIMSTTEYLECISDQEMSDAREKMGHMLGQTLVFQSGIGTRFSMFAGEKIANACSTAHNAIYGPNLNA